MPRSDDHTLHFSEDGTFQISVFEDLHFAGNADRDDQTKQVMRSILDTEDAQLVVLNGDLISGEATKTSDSSDYVHQVVEPLVEAKQPWASTYGNHDSNENLNPFMDVYAQEKQYSTSLTQSYISGSDAGITNYYLMVYPHGRSDGPPALLLWFFDSRGGHHASNRDKDLTPALRGDWVHESVVEWFTEAKANLTAEYGSLPSLAFYHIPVHAMLAFQDRGIDSHTAPGINGERVIPQGAGDTEYDGQDRTFMGALRNTTGLIATFSGHDHDNDWCVKWLSGERNSTGAGLNMCYGRHTGYGGYGNAARGARQILLNQTDLASQVQTWVRLENGSISAPVTLNRTYGHDRYGAAFTSQKTESFGSAAAYDSSPFPLMIIWLVFWSLMYWRQ